MRAIPEAYQRENEEQNAENDEHYNPDNFDPDPRLTHDHGHQAYSVHSNSPQPVIVESASSDAASLRFVNEIAKSLPRWTATQDGTTRFFTALTQARDTYNLAWIHICTLLRARADHSDHTDVALRLALDANSLDKAQRDVFSLLGISQATDNLLRDLHNLRQAAGEPVDDFHIRLQKIRLDLKDRGHASPDATLQQVFIDGLLPQLRSYVVARPYNLL